MADNMMVDLSDLAGFTPYEGLGSSSLLKQDGSFKVQLTKLVPGKTDGNDGKFKLTYVAVVQDEDEKGATLIGDILCSGKDKNGNPMIRQLGEVLLSTGSTLETIRNSLSKQTNVDLNALANALKDKIGYARVEAETYEGRTTSKVKGFITEQAFKDAVAANAHRRPRRDAQPFVSQPGQQAANGVLNGSTGTKAADPTAQLANLGLKL